MTPEEIREFASRGYWIKAELAVEALDSQAAEIKRLEAEIDRLARAALEREWR